MTSQDKRAVWAWRLYVVILVAGLAVWPWWLCLVPALLIGLGLNWWLAQ